MIPFFVHFMRIFVCVASLSCVSFLAQGMEGETDAQDASTVALVEAARSGNVHLSACFIDSGADFEAVRRVCLWREPMSRRDPMLKTIDQALVYALWLSVYGRDLRKCVRLVKSGADARALLKEIRRSTSPLVGERCAEFEHTIDLALAMAFVEALQEKNMSLLRRLKFYMKTNRDLVLNYIEHHVPEEHRDMLLAQLSWVWKVVI